MKLFINFSLPPFSSAIAPSHYLLREEPLYVPPAFSPFPTVEPQRTWDCPCLQTLSPKAVAGGVGSLIQQEQNLLRSFAKCRCWQEHPGKMEWKMDDNTRDKERVYSWDLRPGQSAQAGKRQIPNPRFSAVFGDKSTPGLGFVPVPEVTLLHLFPGEGRQLW